MSDIPASQWRAYLDVADHPEYPSGSAALCGATAVSASLFFGDDKLNYTFPVLKGYSTIEPGITPPVDTDIVYTNWTSFLSDCGNSRIWGGVHFPDAVEVGKSVGGQIGKCAYRFVRAHIDGKLTPANDDSNCKY